MDTTEIWQSLENFIGTYFDEEQSHRNHLAQPHSGLPTVSEETGDGLFVRKLMNKAVVGHLACTHKRRRHKLLRIRVFRSPLITQSFHGTRRV